MASELTENGYAASWRAGELRVGDSGNSPMKMISLVSPCFNEAENVGELYRRIALTMERLPHYRWELIFIDNASTDSTLEKIRGLALRDGRVKAIVNARNFGHIRSPFYGLLQAYGEAVIFLCSDLQEPPELIPEFIKRWEAGCEAVMGVCPQTSDPFWLRCLRKIFYSVFTSFSSTPRLSHGSGFGLYDQRVIETFRKIEDPYPYFRALVAELGFAFQTISFERPPRFGGKSKSTLYSFYDMAMLGLINHSPYFIRFVSLLGFSVGGICGLGVFSYVVAGLVGWAPWHWGWAAAISLLGLQLVLVAILGEYLAAVFQHVHKRPLVVERERINFEDCIKRSSPTKDKPVSLTLQNS